MKKLVWLAFLLPTLLIASDQGMWDSNQSEDPMTDAIRATVFFSDSSNNRILVIRCGTSFADDGIDIIIKWGEYFSDDDTSFAYRFDKEKVEKIHVLLSTTGTSFFLPDRIERKFIAKMKFAGRLVVQASPYREGKQTWIISLSGFTAAYNKHCEQITPVKKPATAHHDSPSKSDAIASLESQLVAVSRTPNTISPIVIQQIDGKKINHAQSSLVSALESYDIDPGVHEIIVAPTSDLDAGKSVTIDVKPGVKYYLGWHESEPAIWKEEKN